MLTNLRELHLCNNRMTQIPKEISMLTNLQHLYLDNNKITQIPNEICMLTKLENLYLDNNKITQIPKEIGMLTNLQELYLNGNILQISNELTNSFEMLTNLQYLSFYSYNNDLPKIKELLKN